MNFNYFIAVISCPPNFKVVAVQKATTNTVVRKEIRSTIKDVLNLTENVVIDKEAFTKLTTKIEVENSTEYFVQFQNAINEISIASYEACYGSKNTLVLAEETPVLINNFEKADSSETRHIFGRLLCLKYKFLTNSTFKLVAKRQTDTDITKIEMWFNDLEVDQFYKLFNFTTDFPTLAFVVDNTGSMSEEIDAVKDLITAIIKAERSSPFLYILGTFNDPGNDISSNIVICTYALCISLYIANL